MLTAEENELLCRVEGHAPMGQLMRRHWIPACMTEEVSEPDGAPIRVRLLGEDLVVFRDTDGRIGVLDEYCPHRRASLALGRNEDCGLRCLYHGWKFDFEGNVLEMTSEPAESGFAAKVKHKAYPAREAAGFVWTYMGPSAEIPEFEQPAFAPTPDVRVSIVKIKVKANWAQITEGQIDSAHSSSLHSSDMVPARVDSATATEQSWLRPSTDRAPKFQVQRTSFGFRYAAIRRPILNANTHDYVRTTVYIAPFTSLIPPNNVYNVTTVLAPADDYNTEFYFIAWNGADKPGVEREAWRKFNVAQVGIDLDADYRNKRTRENNYLQDRQAMKLGNFTGIAGIPNQDIAMWESMGAISDRTKERLGASDVAVAEFRRLMVDAARTMRDSGIAIGRTQPHIPHAKISSFEGIVPKSTDWRTLGISPEELALVDAQERVA
jgi:phthalate 4,5-dioxygenase